MKAKKPELDVDFIGGEMPITPTEEKAISDFLRQRKLASKKKAEYADNTMIKRGQATA